MFILIFTPSTAVLVRKLMFLMTNINKENTYSQGMDNTSNFLNCPSQEHLESTPFIIIIPLFRGKNTVFALVEFPQKITLYLINEWKVCKIGRLISIPT